MGMRAFIPACLGAHMRVCEHTCTCTRVCVCVCVCVCACSTCFWECLRPSIASCLSGQGCSLSHPFLWPFARGPHSCEYHLLRDSPLLSCLGVASAASHTIGAKMITCRKIVFEQLIFELHRITVHLLSFARINFRL